MLATKLFTMHFTMIGFRNLRVVWRSISLTYYIYMNIERWPVWNQLLVSSVLVSLYAVTKVLIQISWLLFCPPRDRRYVGHFLRLWAWALPQQPNSKSRPLTKCFQRPPMVISEKRFLNCCCISIDIRHDLVVAVIYLPQPQVYSTGGRWSNSKTKEITV